MYFGRECKPAHCYIPVYRVDALVRNRRGSFLCPGFDQLFFCCGKLLPGGHDVSIFAVPLLFVLLELLAGRERPFLGFQLGGIVLQWAGSFPAGSMVIVTGWAEIVVREKFAPHSVTVHTGRHKKASQGLAGWPDVMRNGARPEGPSP